MFFKKTLTKRIISLFLSLAIVSTTFPELGLYVHAFAVENSTSIGESDEEARLDWEYLQYLDPESEEYTNLKQVLSQEELGISFFSRRLAYTTNAVYNDYIYMGTTAAGKINMQTRTGDPDNEKDNNRKLLYNYNTSNTLFAIDGKSYSYGIWSACYNDYGDNYVISANTVGELYIEQILTIVENPATGREDTVQIKYRVTNNTENEKQLGCRIVLDTMIGSNDNAPFWVPKYGSVTTETEFSGNELPLYWLAFDSLTEPTITAQGRLYKSDEEKPDRIQFTRWGYGVTGNYYYQVTNGTPNGDSAVSTIWDEKSIAPGETKEYITYYGLGDFSDDLSYPLTLSVYSDSKVEAINDKYVPNPIDITAYIQNISEIDAEEVSVEIELPDGLELASGGNTINIGTLAPNEIFQAAWSVNIKPNAVDKDYQYKVILTAANGYSKIVTRAIHVPALKKKVDFGYTVFSGSTSSDLNLYGWKSNFTGNVYTGKNFNYGGSEFYVDGKIDAVGNVTTNGWKTEITECNESVAIVSIPDFDAAIFEEAAPFETYEESPAYIQDTNIINDSIKVNGDVTISGTTFEGDCYIIAEGNITYNVQEFNTTGRVVLYSRNGNITVNGSSININGILYAPNGSINFNTYETTLNGRIIADTINFSGSIFNIYGQADDWDLIGGGSTDIETEDVAISAVVPEYIGGSSVHNIVISNDNAVEELVYNAVFNGSELSVDEEGGFTLTAPDIGGEYILTISATAPNGGYDSESYTVIVDAEAPIIKINAEKNFVNVGDEPVEVTFTAVDDYLLDSVKIYVNGELSEYTENDTIIISTDEANHYIIRAEASDTAGNISVAEKEIEIIAAVIDTENPTISIEFDKENYIEGDVANITIYAYDNEGVSEIVVTFNEEVLTSENDIFTTPILSSGTHNITVKAYDLSGNLQTITETIEVGNMVSEDSTPPQINVNDILDVITLGETIELNIEASDDSGNVYVKVTANNEVIANAAGIITFTPNEIGEYLLSISAWDDSENITTLSKTIMVTEGASGDTTAPVYVDSEIPEYIIAHEETRIKVTATDDSGKVFYSARINGEEVECNDGEIIFTPEYAGDYIIEVLFYDEAENASGIQLTVYANDQTLPTMTVTGLTHYMTVGETALITIDAQDDSGTVYVTATINSEPVELVDNQFEFAPIETGIYKLIIRAEDPSDNFVQKEFDISVSEAPVYEDDNPVITINANSGSDTANIGDTVDVKVIANDPDGISSLKVTVNGEELQLDENGNASFTPEETGRYVISATAVDSLGNEITEELNIKVVDENDDSVCEATIISPTDGDTVTSPVEIIGSVTGEGLVYYTLEYCSANSNEYMEFAYGEEVAESGVLGEFDPTLLENGYYNIRLTAYSSNYSVSDEIVVSVEGQMKIGNYSIAFQDMDIPVAGYPLTVIRNYDSRRKQTSGDFGYGWDMTLSSISLSESCTPGSYWTQEAAASGYVSKYYFAEDRPHEISVDYGNGQTDKFKMKLSPDQQNFYPINVGISVTYEAQGNTKSKLEAIGATADLIYNGGILCYSSTKIYNPEKYKLTRADGTVYIISDTNGVESITDTNGNTITITEDGVTHSDGKSISFERDSENRITKITGPTGKAIEYSYDGSGNLSFVTDESGEKTTFEYDRNHYLTDIINSNGVKIARNEYDDDGRLIATVDADGNRLEFAHDIDGRRDVVTDRLGNSTLYVYDNRGNVISETDALGNTTLSTYDINGNLATKTDALGNVTTYNYDSEGNLLSMTDALGNTVTNSYSEKNQLLSITSMGVTQFIVDYDEYGNLTSTEDAMGNEISYEYDSGKVTSITDEIGTYMKMTYDGDGNVVSAVNGAGETATFTYDEDGNCASKTITRGSETLTEQYSYDVYGNATQVIYADGSITSVEYDSVGNMTAAVDSKGRRTSYEYDLFGNLVKITYCDNTTETFEYDAEGRNTKATDRMGRSVKMTYDAVGNLISKSYPNGSKVTYSYDKKYRLTSVTAANGGVTSYEYDVLDRNTAITDALGNKTKFGYSTSNGQLETMTDPMGNTYTYGYDLNGNRTSVIMPDGTSVSTAYDARGRVTSQADQYGNVTRYTYDGADRLTSVTDALGSVWKYKYNSVGELVSVTDPMGNTTRYEYDNGGRITKTTNALGNTATATYDEAGNVLTSTDYAGNVTVYIYDELDRVVAKTLGGETTLYSYTTDGLLASVTDNSGTISYEYDIMNGLTAVNLADGKEIHYTYDDSCRLTSVETPFGTTSYKYDVLDRLVRVVAHDGTATLYEYDANGNRTEVHYANGIVIKYVFDEVNRLICEKVLDKDGELVAQYTYTLGAAGERLKVEETDGDSSRTVEYEYDDVYRLISETVTDESGTTVTSYTYDKNSNRLTKTVGEDVTEYSYNELNQLISETGIEYSYDLNGNLIKKKALAETTTYTYNKRNRLIRVTVQNGADVNVEEYLYDYAGNRTAKIQEFKTTYYLVDTNGALSQVLAEYDENGTLITSYARADQLISQERDGVKSYYLYDGFDSVRMLADNEGKVTDTYTYDAFGNLTASTGETENSFLYRGEQYDSFTGLYYLRARYMNPSTGTFITMDEYAGSIFEPVSLHKYLYANANPVMYSDPSGYLSVGELATTMAIQGIVSSIITAEIQLIHFFATAAPNQAFDWGSFWEAVIMGGIFGAGFGAVGAYAMAVKSVAIMTTLGFSSLAFAAVSALEAISYGQQNEGELAATYWFLTAIGLVSAASSFNQAFKFQTANSTAKTTTQNTTSNTSKADTLAKNAAQGKAFEQQEFAKFNQKYNNAVEQITIKTSSGTKTRVDAIGFDSNGNVVIYEFKSSSTAPLTPNQTVAFPEIYESGGIVVGNGKGMFTGGTTIPSGTKITIIRP